VKEISETQKKQLIWLALGEYYQVPLTENQLLMYTQDVEKLSSDDLARAAQSWRNNPENTRCPRPAQLIDLLNPTVSEQGEAVEVANRIWEAIGKFGWPNPVKAKEFIGELGWIVVERYGGWKSICLESNDAEPGIMKAQMRETAKSVAERARAGVLHTPPALPKPDQEIKSIGEIVKKVLEHKEPTP
jgi:hypothetical protein